MQWTPWQIQGDEKAEETAMRIAKGHMVALG
jgi:hypothetical protein